MSDEKYLSQSGLLVLLKKLKTKLLNLISVHNTSSSAHSDIRELVNDSDSKYVSLQGGEMKDNASLTFTQDGNHHIVINGNEIVSDMSNETEEWNSDLISVKDSENKTTTMLGMQGDASGLNYVYMGGDYLDPAMKMTTDGEFTFKNRPNVGSASVALTSDIPEIINKNDVTAYGAVGDGVHDDTDAIQAALNTGGDIYFPAGRYKVTRELTATKPCTISMFKQYPSNAYDDYPKTANDNWMGARIETYSPTNGIVIGDSVNLDGFYIRAMAGFGREANTGTYGGKGIILQYDGSLGYRTYPSAVRLRHIRVDIAFAKNGASDEINQVIPECMFYFTPRASYHYIIEDVMLGQHNGLKYCDYAFRADLEKNTSWSHNVFIRNMCIDMHCDYGVHITGNSGNGGDACGWMFDGLTIQAYPYVSTDVNYQNRYSHRAMIKMSGVQNIAFYSCYLWDTSIERGFIDGAEIIVDGKHNAYDIKNSTTIISCVGCSSHFDVCETYIHKKLDSPENLNIKDLEMGVSSDESTGANVLTLSDGTYTRSVSIPSATISDEQISNSINAYMDDAVIPQKIIGRNKFDATRNWESGTPTPFDDFNFIGYVYTNKYTGQAYYDNASTMWSTHLIAAEYGDVLRISANGTTRQGYSMMCYDKDRNWLGHYLIAAGETGQPETIDYLKPHVALQGTAFVRISFMTDKMIVAPTDEGFPNVCITVNNTDISYEPYKETYEAKMAVLPIVTEADNGKVLKVVDGKWVAV